ncbi:SRPBCC domain-containing protein [Chitinophaga sp. MM2321]|uniref:SRPBCC domain-containing protein n=1 Tax=Chitinophaga sp. MM2321 TaxID=3137178 RepID=UPI0032D5681E
MSTPLFVKSSITIHAPASKVWDALVNPEQTKKYMFGCETVSDWKKGSTLLWKLMHEGKELVAVKGTIEAITPNKLLVYTTIDPNSAIDDTSENYLHVTYDLSEENGHTILNVSQGDYTRVAEGEKRYREAVDGGGWDPILVKIKALVDQD